MLQTPNLCWSDNSAVVQPEKFVVIRKIIRYTCKDAPFKLQHDNLKISNCTIFYENFLVYFKNQWKISLFWGYVHDHRWLIIRHVRRRKLVDSGHTLKHSSLTQNENQNICIYILTMHLHSSVSVSRVFYDKFIRFKSICTTQYIVTVMKQT